MPDKNLETINRNFVIPPGSQVVLKNTIKCENDSAIQQFKKPGNVGVVVKSPPHNDQPYLIRFNDGTEVVASFDEIVLRRKEIDSLLGVQHDFEPNVIYRCQVGSKAFGLSDENSDDDIRGIFIPTAEADWSLFTVPEQIEQLDDQHDVVIWEIEKFLRLALKANPNILETLWTPMVVHTTPLADRLRTIREAFLSKHVYKTYSGYVLSQFRRMKNRFEKTGDFKNKHAMHLLRLLLSGIHAVRTGDIMIDVTEHREYLLRVKTGEFTFEQVRQRALELDREFQTAFDATKLPDQPDFKTVNDFLIEARQSMI
jgi:predicted nucleotidyltransferase